MASSSFAAAPSPSSSVFPDSETLGRVNDTLSSTDGSSTSKQTQSSGNSSSPESHSDAPEAIVIDVDGVSDEEEAAAEEEEGECGFCLFMKGGGCKEQFVAWEKCVEEAEKTGEDVVNKCMEVTSLLKKCMDVHAEYYEPILRVEREMADAVSEAETEDPEKKPAASGVQADEPEKELVEESVK